MAISKLEVVNELCRVLVLLFAAIQDFRTGRISNRLIIAGAGLGILLRMIQSGYIGIVVGMIHILIPILLLFIFYQKSAIGAGDLKLISIISCYMSWKEWFTWFTTSVLCAGVIALMYWTRGKERIAFAVPLCLGMMIEIAIGKGEFII